MDNDTKAIIKDMMVETMNEYFLSHPVSLHTHNGVNSLKINPQDLLGFPTNSVVDASIAPTYPASNGTMTIQYDATHWYLWIRVANLWKKVTLT